MDIDKVRMKEGEGAVKVRDRVVGKLLSVWANADGGAGVAGGMQCSCCSKSPFC